MNWLNFEDDPKFWWRNSLKISGIKLPLIEENKSSQLSEESMKSTSIELSFPWFIFGKINEDSTWIPFLTCWWAMVFGFKSNWDGIVDGFLAKVFGILRGSRSRFLFSRMRNNEKESMADFWEYCVWNRMRKYGLEFRILYSRVVRFFLRDGG